MKKNKNKTKQKRKFTYVNNQVFNYVIWGMSWYMKNKFYINIYKVGTLAKCELNREK